MISSPVNSAPVAPPVFVTAAAVAAIEESLETAYAAPASDAAEPFAPASIVNLSAQALQLSSSSSSSSAIPNSNILADAENVEQLGAIAWALQIQDTNAAQSVALNANQQALINTALGSMLADAALVDAIAATTSASDTALSTAGLTNDLTQAATSAVQVATQTAAANALTGAVASEAATTATATAAATTAAIGSGASSNANLQPAATPLVLPTDPAIAAAIAAYHLGDGLISGDEHTPQAPSLDANDDVTAVDSAQSIELSLHGGGKDDITNGAAWNRLRIDPIRRSYTQR